MAALIGYAALITGVCVIVRGLFWFVEDVIEGGQYHA